ncbi:hypothetical protein QR685DRAFT_563893 [Neurospora intermedia]|uniref:Uncharacterized protein n=1 Tax=Neurospora intermedia TaxID=5142 RepID=A0ABR3D7N6_NEUIN
MSLLWTTTVISAVCTRVAWDPVPEELPNLTDYQIQSQTDDRVLEKQLNYLDDVQRSISIRKQTYGSSLYL